MHAGRAGRYLMPHMKINILLTLVCCAVSAFAFPAAAAQPPIWQDVTEKSIAVNSPRPVVPRAYRVLQLNDAVLRQLVAQAPMEFTQAAKDVSVVLELPMPDGGFQRFRIQESPISLPDPSGKVSSFSSYSGQGIDDPTATVRFDISPAGFHAQILRSGEAVYIDPYATGDTTNVISYFRRDLERDGHDHDHSAKPQCLLPDGGILPPGFTQRSESPDHISPQTASGATLHRFRTAIAATAEYTTFFRQAGDNDQQAKERALAAIKVTMNRVTGIWERDVAVRYVLLSDADEMKIIYTDPATDPYTNENANSLLNENQINLDKPEVVGDANYDIGHVFATSPGGVGGGGVCLTGQKAKGATGLSKPVGDPFDVDYVAHEIIHQWQGGHTFNESQSEQCNTNNRTPDSAFEPGSGSTLTSYAGICGAANLQKSSDDYFHSGTAAEVQKFLAETATCANKVATGNTPPNVTAPASFTIPKQTPFTLTASGSDADGDALTYGWEQFDLGAPSPPFTDDGTRPILRPYRPTVSPSRTFPSLPYILNNANNPPQTFTGTSPMGAVCADEQTCLTGELLPTAARAMKFRVTVRDNRVNGGGTNYANTVVNVRGDSGPFVVTAPNSASTQLGGSQLTVTWDVANTTAAPVNAANVKISLSTDGGNTFPTVLLNSTSNDGSEAVVLPNVSVTTARIKVEAVDNIFFDVSDANFTITATAATPTPTPTATPTATASPSATPTPTASPTPAATPTVLGNIATRMRVETGENALIGGIIITGNQAKKIIVRAIGPSLTLDGKLQDPQLQLFNSQQEEIAANNNWKDNANQQEIVASGVAPTNDLEAAILITLQPGNYTAVVRGVNNTTGIGVAEIYDLDRSANSKLANIATRGFVQTGDNVMIGGFIILGETNQKVIIRAIGPSLTIDGKLADPTLDLVDNNGNVMRSNNNWKENQQAEIEATTIPPQNELESAIVDTLPPAPYTAVVRGFGGGTGIAVVEVYALQ